MSQGFTMVKEEQAILLYQRDDTMVVYEKISLEAQINNQYTCLKNNIP